METSSVPYTEHLVLWASKAAERAQVVLESIPQDNPVWKALASEFGEGEAAVELIDGAVRAVAGGAPTPIGGMLTAAAGALKRLVPRSQRRVKKGASLKVDPLASDDTGWRVRLALAYVAKDDALRIRLLRRVLDELERGSLSASDRAELSGHADRAYRDAVDLCLQRSEQTDAPSEKREASLLEAWEWATRASARSLLDLVHTDPSALGEDIGLKYETWRGYLPRAEKARAQAAGYDSASPLRVANQEDQRYYEEAECRWRKDLAQAVASRTLPVVPVPPAPDLVRDLATYLQDVETGTPRPGVLLEFFRLAPERYAAFVVNVPVEGVKHGVRVRGQVLDLDRPADEMLCELQEAVQQLHGNGRLRLRATPLARVASEPKADNEALAQCERVTEWAGQSLLAPLAESISQAAREVSLPGAQVCLVIVPHGPLHGLPLHAAPIPVGLEQGGTDEGTVPLVDAYPLAVLPNAALASLLVNKQRKRIGSARRLILGPPGEDLPAAMREVKALSTKWRAPEEDCCALERMVTTPLLGVGEAQEAAGEGFEIVHIASHSVFDQEDARASYVRFYHDRLSVYDLLLSERGVRARLLYLSSCESAKSKAEAEDDLEGLTGAFLQAGAEAVIASLWPVHDEAASQMAEDFYARLDIGDSVSEAYQFAVRQLREDPDFGSPFFWAPFVLYGDGFERISSRAKI